jgi:hypothetical protein
LEQWSLDGFSGKGKNRSVVLRAEQSQQLALSFLFGVYKADALSLLC